MNSIAKRVASRYAAADGSAAKWNKGGKDKYVRWIEKDVLPAMDAIIGQKLLLEIYGKAQAQTPEMRAEYEGTVLALHKALRRRKDFGHPSPGSTHTGAVQTADRILTDLELFSAQFGRPGHKIEMSKASLELDLSMLSEILDAPRKPAKALKRQDPFSE